MSVFNTNMRDKIWLSVCISWCGFGNNTGEKHLNVSKQVKGTQGNEHGY